MTFLRFIAVFLFILAVRPLSAELLKKGWGWHPFERYLGVTLSFNPDKSYLSTYIDFKKRKPVDLSTTGELTLYRRLFLKSLLPSFVLLELTYYPLTDLGGFLFKHKRSTYNRFGFDSPDVGNRGNFNINLIGAMASRYETPYALSLFLGDIIPFFIKSKNREANSPPLQAGSALMGFVLTFGQRRMKQLEILSDNWFHLSWKVKGNRKTPDRKMAWRYQIGYLYHSNHEFINAITFSALRDKATTNKMEFSLLNNSKVEYLFHIPVERVSKGNDLTEFTTFQKIVAGINFPLSSLYILTMEIGFKWQAIKNLDEETPESDFSLIFIPGLKW